MAERRFWVYILANTSRTIYIGVTSNLARRVQEHKSHTIEGFTKRYGIDQLVYYVEFSDPRDAIEFEKQLKGWGRAKKVALIEAENPNWFDLAERWAA